MKASKCLVGLLVVSAAGCATQAGTAGLECGIGGAVLGAAACELTTHDHAKCAAIAAASAGIGAIACSSYAHRLDARNQELKGKENNLNAQIQYVHELNADTEQLNNQLAARVSSMTKDTDAVVAQINRLSQARLQQERSKRDDLLKVSQQEVSKGTEALQTAKNLRAKRQGDSSDLDAAITRQEQLLAQAQHQVDLLAQQRARV